VSAAIPTDSAPQKSKPRLSYLLATGFGLGYLKPAPGTWGSALGVGISILLTWFSAQRILAILHMQGEVNFWTNGWTPGWSVLIADVLIAAAGVLVSNNVVHHSGKKDPQFVVIDEISGQLIALSMPFAVLSWKSWLVGFILFRVFDVWKPFPARQAEYLPAGWGIMADDWVAGIYAGILLCLIQWLRILK
jgi:phosphatidylglycerophosphatase A